MKLNPIPIALSLLLAAPALVSGVAPARDGGSGGVTLRATVPAGGVINTGDRIAFEFQTREPAAVVLFSIDSRGFVHLLHPMDGVEVARANTTYSVPGPGGELVVDGRTGVEFVFALAVTDLSALDVTELDHLRSIDHTAEPYRISGDPFIAANMIAGDLVRGVSRREAVFGYTHFYVNERIEYPCYLCGACDGESDDTACSDYRVVQNFDRRSPLSFPLRRGYDMVEAGASYASEDVYDVQEPSDVVVNFYPYGSEVRYVDPVAYAYYDYGWGLWDPFYWYWPGYYPYCGRGWSVSVGWGWGWPWGWGWHRGYYCSGWYAYPYDYAYPRYRGDYSYPDRFKAKYKSDASSAGLLTAHRTRAAQKDGSLRIAQKDVQRSVTKVNRAATGKSARDAYIAGRTGAPRVKTSVWSGSGKPSVRAPGTRTGSRPSGIKRGETRSRPDSRGAVKPGTKSRPRGSSGGAVKGRSGGKSKGSSGTTVKGSSRSRGSSGSAVKSKAGSRGSSRSGSSATKSRGSSSSSRSKKR